MRISRTHGYKQPSKSTGVVVFVLGLIFFPMSLHKLWSNLQLARSSVETSAVVEEMQASRCKGGGRVKTRSYHPCYIVKLLVTTPTGDKVQRRLDYSPRLKEWAEGDTIRVLFSHHDQSTVFLPSSTYKFWGPLGFTLMTAFFMVWGALCALGFLNSDVSKRQDQVMPTPPAS